MEPGQAGRRWNKKHFCSSPFPSPGRPPRHPRRASPSRAPAPSQAPHDPRPQPSSARPATAAAAGEGRRPAPCPQGGPRGESGSAGRLTPPSTPHWPFLGQIPESTSERSP